VGEAAVVVAILTFSLLAMLATLEKSTTVKSTKVPL
jgi:hypothetical protein